MTNYFYKGKEVRSRSDRDRDVKLSWAHTVTLKHTDINFRVTDSVANFSPIEVILLQYETYQLTPTLQHYMKDPRVTV